MLHLLLVLLVLVDEVELHLAAFGILNALGEHARVDGDLVLLEEELKRASQFLVEQRQDRVHGFHDGDFGAEHAEGDAELKPDVAATNNDHVVGQVFEGQGFSRGEHVVAEGHEREFNGHGALGHDDVLGLNEGGVLAFTDLDGLGVLEHRPAAYEFSTGVLQERLNAFVQAVNNAFFPTDEVAHVKFSRSGDGDAHVAVLAGVLGQVVEGVGSVNEGFAGNAAANQTGTASSLAFNDDGLQAELSGTDGSDVATGACADDENLALLCLHCLHLT